MDRPFLIVDCVPEAIVAIRDGRKRAILLPDRPMSTDYGLIFKAAEQTSSAIVTLVERNEGDGSLLVHFDRVWTHSSGDEYESVLHLVEHAAAHVRRLSHAGVGTPDDFRKALRSLAKVCDLWSAAVSEIP